MRVHDGADRGGSRRRADHRADTPWTRRDRNRTTVRLHVALLAELDRRRERDDAQRN